MSSFCPKAPELYKAICGLRRVAIELGLEIEFRISHELYSSAPARRIKSYTLCKIMRAMGLDHEGCHPCPPLVETM